MSTLTGRVTIDAPIEQVFLYMDDPRNQAVITPALSSVEPISILENGGKRASYRYAMGPIGLTGEVVATTYIPNQAITFELHGDLSGTIDWEFEQVDGTQTRVTYSATYELPGPFSWPLCSLLTGPGIRRYNRRQLVATLTELKKQIEMSAD
ncbi:SRPBCC family protein [Halorubraceae archaeon YAN]|nr:SRPBCC family protein [Halorubraceae archaeon YAN]